MHVPIERLTRRLLLLFHDNITSLYPLQYHQQRDNASKTGSTSTTGFRYQSMILRANCRIILHASHTERLLVVWLRSALRGSTSRIHQVTNLACPYTAAGRRRNNLFASALEKSVCRRLSTICPCDHGPARTHPVATSQRYRTPAGQPRRTRLVSVQALAACPVAACSWRTYRASNPSPKDRGKSVE